MTSPGALNKQADLLLRRVDHDQGKEDNQDVVLLKPEYFRAQEIVLEGGTGDHGFDQI
jgi:hypothetical protein